MQEKTKIKKRYCPQDSQIEHKKLNIINANGKFNGQQHQSISTKEKLILKKSSKSVG